jgi:hypothetical protein
MATVQIFRASLLLDAGVIDARISKIILSLAQTDGIGPAWTASTVSEPLGFNAESHGLRVGIRRNLSEDPSSRIFVFEADNCAESQVDRLVDEVVEAITADLLATTWTTLEGPRQVASILDRWEADNAVDITPPPFSERTAAENLGRPLSYLKARAPTIGRLERAGMVGGLELVRDILHAALVRGPASTHRSVLAKAVRLARALPVEVVVESGEEDWESKDAFEYPTFATLMSGRQAVTSPALDRGWPLKGSQPGEDTEGLAIRSDYLKSLVSGGALLLRARGLAMVFPFLHPGEQHYFLGEIVQALVAAQRQDVGTAIGMVAVCTLRLPRLEGGALLPFSPADMQVQPHSISFHLLAAIVAVKDPALRARICIEAFKGQARWGRTLDESVCMAVRSVGQGALDALAAKARAGGAPAALFEAVQIHDAYARNTAFAAPIMAVAADLARLIPHPFDRAVFLLVVSQLYSERERPNEAHRLMNEAIVLLDAGRHNFPDSLTELWFARFRECHPATPLDETEAARAPSIEVFRGFHSPAIEVILGIHSPEPNPNAGTVADVLHDWASKRANQALESEVKGIWSSLPHVAFPAPMPPATRALRQEIVRQARELAEKTREDS